jgi:hypothetical protein
MQYARFSFILRIWCDSVGAAPRTRSTPWLKPGACARISVRTRLAPWFCRAHGDSSDCTEPDKRVAPSIGVDKFGAPYSVTPAHSMVLHMEPFRPSCMPRPTVSSRRWYSPLRVGRGPGSVRVHAATSPIHRAREQGIMGCGIGREAQNGRRRDRAPDQRVGRRRTPT